jgi:D-alanine-D-alanine ligase
MSTRRGDEALAAVDPGLPGTMEKVREKTARVAVLMGGMSTEREISLKSGKAVAQALEDRGWDVVRIDLGPDLPARLVAERIDVCWLALHGPFGEDGTVQGLLEVMRIPYTGSGVRASAVSMDKISTKRMLQDTGVRLPADVVWRKGEFLPEGVPMPVIAKTPRGGSTIGIVKVDTEAELEPALVELSRMDDQVLLEQRIVGDEITVAMLEGRALPVVMIRPKDRDGFFDFEAKYTSGCTDYIVPAPISEAAAADATRQALVAWSTLGLSGVARADFIVDAEDRAWFLEVNTIPGMTATSLSPMAAAAVGVDFGALVEILLEGATLHIARAARSDMARPGQAATSAVSSPS